MLSSLLSGDIKTFLVSFILSLPIVFLSLSLHETAHGFAAFKLGDPTARNLGRLTLNPIKHIDPIGFICMALFGFGWAKPVPINTRFFKKPKRDMAISAAAGPISNILLALIFAVLLRAQVAVANAFPPTTLLAAEAMYWLRLFLYLGVSMNVTLAVFNLIPIPPFDGSRILLAFLPTELYFKIMRYEKYIYIVLLVALFFGLLDGPINFVTDLFMNLIFTVTF